MSSHCAICSSSKTGSCSGECADLPRATVIDPDPAALVPDEILVACSPEMLVQLALNEPEPIVMLGIRERDDHSFELLARRPSRQELAAAITERFMRG